MNFLKKTLSIFFVCLGVVASGSADALDLGVVKFTEGDIGLWMSTGSSRSAHTTFLAENHPTSILVNHDNVGWLEGNSRFYIPVGEARLRGNVRFDVPLINKSAIFDDEDFCSGTAFSPSRLLQISDCGRLTRWSFTQSDGEMDEGLYWHFDFDFLTSRSDILFAGGATELNFRAFYGLAHSEETFIYHNYTVLVDLRAFPFEVGRTYTPDGPFITHDIEWDYHRFGLQADFSRKKSNRLRRLNLTLVTIPLGSYSLDDSHHLRTDPAESNYLGPVPNILSRASDVSGYEYEIEYSYENRFNRNREIYLSYRHRHLEADGINERNIPGGPHYIFPAEFESNRSGLLIGYRVRF